MRFYLGSHIPAWLGRTDVPLFVSRSRLAGLKRLPKALGPWALDSGGFTQLSLHGCWTVEPQAYAAEVQRWAAEIGRMEWAAVQDWMCEDAVRAKTGLKVRDHQLLTVESYLRLRELAPEITWAPVLQGRSLGDYMTHVEDYAQAGVDLRELPIVGGGSICRRQATTFAGIVIRWLAHEGIRLHGFGFKATGLLASQDYLTSADSLAWSYNARKNPPLPECAAEGRHKRCTSCLRYALEWRAGLLDRLERPEDRWRASA